MSARYRLLTVLSLLGCGLGFAGGAAAEQVTAEEARRVATNFIAQIQAQKGSWGAHDRARIASVEPFTGADRLLGYACDVAPAGYILVSAYRELAPVRGYSVRSELDPQRGPDLIAALKAFQLDVIKGIEAELGRRIRSDDDLSAIIPMSFDPQWRSLLDPDFRPTVTEEPPRKRSVGIDYQEGEEMCSTTWGQQPPYNDQCPSHNCDWSYYNQYNDRCRVGCVAVAGAQICAYWHWPPEGTGSGYDVAYDWVNMVNQFVWSESLGLFYALTDAGASLATQEQVDAVALLSRKVGVGVNMNYGCSSSGAQTEDLHWALPNYFRYSESAFWFERTDYSYSEYIAHIVQDLNQNRPVAYRIPGHAVVVDGWDEDLGVYYFHVLYGHSGSANDGWWTIGEIPGGGSTDEHYVVAGFCPAGSLGAGPLGEYTLPSYPYRYFNRDARIITAEFAPGHQFQILKSGLYIETMENTVDWTTTFHGEPGLGTAFYLDGDPEHETRVRINDGTVRLNSGGMIAFH